ncbi:hypothetical protein FACS189418_7730 [Clostridia bacterium]|nr:hypothetical protein FACS189418_7730 [Clostridia bacterium]
MEIITQTNRTMLFDEVNPEKLDLLTMVGDVKGMDSLDDDKIKEIRDTLMVKNFDEFLDKFEPVVYSFFNAHNQQVVYTLKKPENLPESYVTPIYINVDNDFLKMLLTLINAKGAQGLANVDFKFDKVLDMISPKKVMDDIRQARKEIRYVFGQYDELDDEDPKKLDVGDKLNYLFEKASTNYNNVMAMLPLAIEDIKTRLLLGAGDSGQNEVFKAGYLTMGETGELKIVEIEQDSGTDLALLEDKTATGLISAFEEDYDSLNEDEVKSDYVRDLVIRTFVPLTTTVGSDIDTEIEVNNYNNYLDFYKTTKDAFIKTVKPLIEKILGVKLFFDQYRAKVKGMAPTLLIANCKVEMMVKASNLPRIITFLNTVNDKNDFDNTIWFGIVPAIELEVDSTVKLQRQRFAGNKKEKKSDLVTVESLAQLLQVMKSYRVQTFFSFQTGEDTSFNYVATEGLEKFKDKCSSLLRKDYSEFAIPCLPNFTIVPKNKSGLVLDQRMTIQENGAAALSQEKEDLLKMWIEGVYIGASFVAAGIVASYQCPEFLRTHFRNVTPKYPGVRFDIEAKDNALYIPITLAKEISGFTNNIKAEINRQNFGFIFSSENAQLKGKDIRQIMVYKTRSLMSVENEYESIYKTLVTTYVQRMLRFFSHDYKQDNIIEFFSKNPASQKSQWLSTRDYLNSVMQEGDDIDYKIDERDHVCMIDITFNGNIRNLEVEIDRKTNEAF